MTSRPTIDDAPGIIWRPRKVGWEIRWQARRDLVLLGYEPKSVPLWKGSDLRPVDIATIQRQCRDLQAKMLTWGKTHRPPRQKRDGKHMRWLKAHANYSGNDCLKWPFNCDTGGYGLMYANGKTPNAHRVMCELVNGPAPTERHQAAHSCGNGHLACVNPTHLSWKTNRENQLDRRKHGTAIRGIDTKLNHAAAAKIRQLRGTDTYTAIGRQFGVSRDTIRKVMTGQTWKSA